MDEEQQLPEPKISDVEALYIGCILVIVSIVNLIPLAGDFTSMVAGGLMFYYLYVKGLTNTSIIATNSVGYAIGFIPILQALPTELVAWIATVIIDRNPKLEAAAKIAGELEGAGAISGTAATGVAAGGAGATAKIGATGAPAAIEEGVPAEVEAGRAPGAIEAEAGGATGAPAATEAPSPTGEGEAPGGAAPKREIAPEELGEEPELLGEKGKLKRQLFEETPSEKALQEAKEKARREEEGLEDEPEEDMPMAA